MKRVMTGVAAAGLAFVCAGEARSADSAVARLTDGAGKAVGEVQLQQTPAGVLLLGSLQGLPAGPHGFHFHQTGACDGPGFESAGAHFNPADKQHGFRNEQGAHAGDLPNIHVAQDGTAGVEHLAHQVTLAQGGATLLDEDGAALVIHAAADDHATDPSGESGDRIACGIVEAQ